MHSQEYSGMHFAQKTQVTQVTRGPLKLSSNPKANEAFMRLQGSARSSFFHWYHVPVLHILKLLWGEHDDWGSHMLFNHILSPPFSFSTWLLVLFFLASQLWKGRWRLHFYRSQTQKKVHVLMFQCTSSNCEQSRLFNILLLLCPSQSECCFLMSNFRNQLAISPSPHLWPTKLFWYTNSYSILKNYSGHAYYHKYRKRDTFVNFPISIYAPTIALPVKRQHNTTSDMLTILNKGSIAHTGHQNRTHIYFVIMRPLAVNVAIKK